MGAAALEASRDGMEPHVRRNCLLAARGQDMKMQQHIRKEATINDEFKSIRNRYPV